MDLDYEAVDKFARSHGEMALINSVHVAAATIIAHLATIQKRGSVLALYC